MTTNSSPHLVSSLTSLVILEKHTRIDTSDLLLWHGMGLPVNEIGELEFGLVNTQAVTPAQPLQQVIYWRALIWLMCKVVNFDPPASVQPMIDPSRSARYTKLQNDLNEWYNSLPVSFHADTVMPFQEQQSRGLSDLFAKEIWFSHGLCAYMHLVYHAAHMILLMRRPIDHLVSSARVPNQLDLLRATRDLDKQLRIHAQEILAVVIAKPEDLVIPHMIMPLYLAGLCINDRADQAYLIELFESIRDDMGLDTEYRINDLIREWGLTRADIRAVNNER